METLNNYNWHGKSLESLQDEEANTLGCRMDGWKDHPGLVNYRELMSFKVLHNSPSLVMDKGMNEWINGWMD